MRYRNLEIWKLAEEIVIEIHSMTLLLPRFEFLEEGSRIRRSSKSTKSCIVEGYGRRFYKKEYLKFLTYAIASNDETIDHLENLFKTKSLQDEERFLNLLAKLTLLGKKVNLFIAGVQRKY